MAFQWGRAEEAASLSEGLLLLLLSLLLHRSTVVLHGNTSLREEELMEGGHGG
jgi:hypothetical protein